jgi:class 3 adenylate cyclase
MEVNEAGTLARQKAHRQEQIDPLLHQYGGRVAKTTGDGLLVEFASVIDALKQRSANTTSDRKGRSRETRGGAN